MPYIIAEIAQAHEGKLDLAHSYIDALAKTGVDAVKFQVHIADAESSRFEPFRIKFHTEDKSRFDYWKRMEFSLEQWNGLKNHCDGLGVEFIASPFSNAAVELLEKVGVSRYKIGSGEVTNLLLLEKISTTKKPVIISSGLSSFDELDHTVEFLKRKEIDFSILQCTSAYPTQPKEYGLNVILELKNRYGVQVGFSDHSAKIETGIAATALGAEILEIHAVFDRNSNGPDASSSLEISEIKDLVNAVRNIHTALKNPISKADNSNFIELKKIFEKSLAVNKKMLKGSTINFGDLEAKKPKGFGIEAKFFREVIGKKATRDLDQWEFLQNEDFS